MSYSDIKYTNAFSCGYIIMKIPRYTGFEIIWRLHCAVDDKTYYVMFCMHLM